MCQYKCVTTVLQRLLICGNVVVAERSTLAFSLPGSIGRAKEIDLLTAHGQTVFLWDFYLTRKFAQRTTHKNSAIIKVHNAKKLINNGRQYAINEHKSHVRTTSSNLKFNVDFNYAIQRDCCSL